MKIEKRYFALGKDGNQCYGNLTVDGHPVVVERIYKLLEELKWECVY